MQERIVEIRFESMKLNCELSTSTTVYSFRPTKWNCGECYIYSSLLTKNHMLIDCVFINANYSCNLEAVGHFYMYETIDIV